MKAQRRHIVLMLQTHSYNKLCREMNDFITFARELSCTIINKCLQNTNYNLHYIINGRITVDIKHQLNKI